MVQDRAIVTTANQYKVVYDLSIGIMYNDLELSLTQISRSRQYSTLNISVMVTYYILSLLRYLATNITMKNE